MDFDLDGFKKKYGLTDAEIAKLVGVCTQTVRLWRRGGQVYANYGNDEAVRDLDALLKGAKKKKWYKGEAFDYICQKKRRG